MDNKDIENFYKEIYRKKVNIIARILQGDRATAEDVVQEAFTRMLKYSYIYDSEKASVETWFNSIMFNVLWGIKRENMATPVNRSEDLSVGQILDLDRLQTSPELRAFIIKEIESVRNPRHKKVLFLFFMFGYSSSEIAEMGFDMSQSNVTTIVNRFKNLLKESDNNGNKDKPDNCSR